MITLGIDAHKRTHTVVAVDEVGRQLGCKTTTSATSEDHLSLVRWADRFGPERTWAVEDCRHLSRRLEADLLGAGERIVRVPPKLMAGARDSARTYGKSDPIDALAVARAALRHLDLPVARLDGPSRELRLLVDHREDLVAERTRCINRLRWHLHELDPAWDPGARSLTRYVRIEGMVARVALEVARRVREISEQEKGLEREISALVADLAPHLLALPGVGARRGQDRRRGGRRPSFQVKGHVRPSQRHRALAGVVGKPRTPPSQPDGQPPAQCGHPPHGDHPGPLPRGRRCLPQAQGGHGQHIDRGTPRVEAAAI